MYWRGQMSQQPKVPSLLGHGRKTVPGFHDLNVLDFEIVKLGHNQQ